MRKVLKGLRIVGIALCTVGCLWFLMPLLHGGFFMGTIFGFSVSAAGMLLLLFYRRMTERGGWRKNCVNIVCVAFCLGLCWAGYLTGMMLSAQYRTPPRGVNVIVLGAQVYSAERMGVSLTGRVEKAYEYLSENPEAQCIVTGGQGSDEPCPEALTQRNVLVNKGIDKNRIYMEDESKNTRENLNFAMAIARQENLGTEFVIVTQSFHMYRALMLAENAGFTAYSLVADTDPILFPEYFGRELLSLTKWHIERMILE